MSESYDSSSSTVVIEVSSKKSSYLQDNTIVVTESDFPMPETTEMTRIPNLRKKVEIPIF